MRVRVGGRYRVGEPLSRLAPRFRFSQFIALVHVGAAARMHFADRLVDTDGTGSLISAARARAPELKTSSRADMESKNVRMRKREARRIDP